MLYIHVFMKRIKIIIIWCTCVEYINCCLKTFLYVHNNYVIPKYVNDVSEYRFVYHCSDSVSRAELYAAPSVLKVHFCLQN